MGKRRVAATSLIVVFAMAACGGDKKTSPPSLTETDPGIVHAHGLGIDPADGALFIATHTGLFRAAEGENKASRVGKAFQDTMGFTVTGPGRFLGSGHPDAQRNQPLMLGLIESVDSGKSWSPVTLEGEADFHVLRTAGPVVVGYDSIGNRLLRMTAGGKATKLSKPRGTVIDLVVDPGNARHYVVATDSGIYDSVTAGTRWSRLDSRRTGLLAYLESGGLTLVRGDGVVEQLSSGREWRQVGEVQGRPGALAAHEDALYLAVQDGPVLYSPDGGRTWETRVAAGG
ncbi:MAG: F510_1955 family glycosylhydrolase [Solirubrobacteraceae bacterium]